MKNGKGRAKDAVPPASDRRKFFEDLADRLMRFAARVGKIVDAVPDTRLGRHVAGQLVRCGTAPMPNYEEARGAESMRDFAHKMGICLKELRESRGWVKFIVYAELLPPKRMADVIDEAEQLCNIFGQSVLTTKKRIAADPKAAIVLPEEEDI